MAKYWKVFDKDGDLLGIAATTDAADAVDLALHAGWPAESALFSHETKV